MIKHIKGDATVVPNYYSKVLIIHVVNDIGKWGAGFTADLTKKWPLTRHFYREWFNNRKDLNDPFEPWPFLLGTVLFIEVSNNVKVGHMLAQHGVRSKTNTKPLDYNALSKCLETVKDFALEGKYLVQAPKFGSGLAGGDWNKIEAMIEEQLCSKGIEVHIYERGNQ